MKNRIYNHIIPEIGKIPLNRLSQSDLQQFYAKEKTDGRKLHAKTYGKGLSDRTIRGIHANCRTALQRAVQEGLIRTNPAVGCKLPPKARRCRCWRKNEIIRFLHQAKEEGYYELFLLELGTGMRRGEILALKWRPELQNRRAAYRAAGVYHQGGNNYIGAENKKPQYALLFCRRHSSKLSWCIKKRWIRNGCFRHRRITADREIRHRLENGYNWSWNGRAVKGALSRSAAHLCDHGAGARYGCENALGNHRPCVLGNHAWYITMQRQATVHWPQNRRYRRPNADEAREGKIPPQSNCRKYRKIGWSHDKRPPVWGRCTPTNAYGRRENARGMRRKKILPKAKSTRKKKQGWPKNSVKNTQKDGLTHFIYWQNRTGVFNDHFCIWKLPQRFSFVKLSNPTNNNTVICCGLSDTFQFIYYAKMRARNRRKVLAEMIADVQIIRNSSSPF